MGESVNNLLQKSDELIVNMVKEAGELVKNFIELSKSDPIFKDYYHDFADVGVQIFKIHEKLHVDFAELKECEGIKALKEYKG
ncbi:chemotaxis protein [Campylobacter showae]|uniref:chemotaxis protein n=1 Tax=Campylobacter showae TaxID=204 RepID=UPI000F086634|nr:chemotaxis protein [Campylobacter showae]